MSCCIDVVAVVIVASFLNIFIYKVDDFDLVGWRALRSNFNCIYYSSVHSFALLAFDFVISRGRYRALSLKLCCLLFFIYDVTSRKLFVALDLSLFCEWCSICIISCETVLLCCLHHRSSWCL